MKTMTAWQNNIKIVKDAVGIEEISKVFHLIRNISLRVQIMKNIYYGREI